MIRLALSLTFWIPMVVADEVEVLHYWTSGGEAKSVAFLQARLADAGVNWKDFAVAGGGGENATTVLKSRAISGNPPSAAQLKGPSIAEWGELGFLADIDDVAAAGEWDALLPDVVADAMRYEGRYVAAPVNVHRVNWLWANAQVFEAAGARLPVDWNDFFVQAGKLKAAGFIPLAHGGQAWQDATLFETVALGVGGAEYYRRAFVELDEAALNSETTLKVFDVFGQIRPLIDSNASGRDWNLATNMVIQGEAGMQIMGDWAKGEFSVAGQQPELDYLCAPAPGTNGVFSFNVDSFAFFVQSDPAAQNAQKTMAREILSPEFQEVFNLSKGSIPARLDMPAASFDACAQASMKDFANAADTGTLVPSFAHGMAVSEAVSGAIFDVATNFFNSSATPEQGMAELVSAIKASR